MAKPQRRPQPQLPKQRPLQVMIGTTSLYGEVSTFVVSSLLRLCDHFSKIGIRYTYACVDGPHIEGNHNRLASLCLQDPATTHLLIVDARLQFDPDRVAELLAQHRPISCFDAPSDGYSLSDLFDTASLGSAVPESYTAIAGGFREATTSTLGLALIERRVFQMMVDRKFVTRCLDTDEISEHDFHASPPVYGFFSPVADLEGRHATRWHLSFCERWAKMGGGPLWVSTEPSFPFVQNVALKASFANRMPS